MFEWHEILMAWSLVTARPHHWNLFHVVLFQNDTALNDSLDMLLFSPFHYNIHTFWKLLKTMLNFLLSHFLQT